jgi:hypothetical protein
MKDKIEELGPWEQSLIWAGLAGELVARFAASGDFISRLRGVAEELRTSILDKNVEKIEELSEAIEGTDDADSALTQSHLFEHHGSDWYLYGLVIDAISQAINVLYLSRDVINVSSWFFEECRDFYESLTESAQSGGFLGVVNGYLEGNV